MGLVVGDVVVVAVVQVVVVIVNIAVMFCCSCLV